MHDHYGFTDEEWGVLSKQGITIRDLYKAVTIFDPHQSGAPISKVNLLYYIDEKGDFHEPPFFPHKKIAKALFDKLDNKNKLEIYAYLEGEEEDDDL